ncbi:30S ribosomal protein S9 [Glycomyces artemisiae]|uniref:Small ribosomal subunit protein uS9 n=1 Tax=Glycomyces artemisiae TaxID=1076443 RepID=A0A2T0UIL4_9ACTN|nr:small subunit ribosomal protein S9 [Glycomyces artemisiae]
MSDEIQATEAVETEAVEAPAAAEAPVETPEAVEAPVDVPVEVPADVAAAPSVPSIPVVPVDRPIQTVGRRKRAIARVRLVPGTGKYVVNGKSLEDYFPSKVHQQTVAEPFVTVEAGDNFDVLVNIHGGGATGQAGALRLGIARALVEIDPNTRPALKAAGFLTRDAREKESKKYGLKKARKAPQYSKR